jgi:hypothetical protein
MPDGTHFVFAVTPRPDAVPFAPTQVNVVVNWGEEVASRVVAAR